MGLQNRATVDLQTTGTVYSSDRLSSMFFCAHNGIAYKSQRENYGTMIFKLPASTQTSIIFPEWAVYIKTAALTESQ